MAQGGNELFLCILYSRFSAISRYYMYLCICYVESVFLTGFDISSYCII